MSTVQENLELFIVLGVIAVLIVVLAIVLIALTVKAKKIAPAKQTTEEAPAPAPEQKEDPTPAAEEPAQAEETKEEPAPAAKEPAPVAEKEEKEEPAPAPAVEEPAPIEEEPAEEEAVQEKEEETMNKEPTTEEKKSAKRTSSSPYVYKPGKAEEKKTAEKPAAPAAPAKTGANGKWVIEDVRGKFWFSLYANNGQVMLESSTAYATLASARSGIKTYQENIAAGRLEITEHKNGDFQVNILNGRGALLATSSTYTSRSDCEKAMESIKRWATSTTVEEPNKNA